MHQRDERMRWSSRKCEAENVYAVHRDLKIYETTKGNPNIMPSNIEPSRDEAELLSALQQEMGGLLSEARRQFVDSACLSRYLRARKGNIG